MKEFTPTKIIHGEVVDIQDKHPGEYHIVEARVRTDDEKIWVCVLWNEDAERFMKEPFLNRRVHFEGREKEEGKLTCKYFSAVGKVSSSNPTHGVAQKDFDGYRRDRVAKGFEFVQVSIDNGRKITVSKPRRHCVKVNGVWESKMEYVMRILTPKFVTDSLREFRDDGRPGSVAANVNPIRFNEILNRLVDVAGAQEGDYIEWGYGGPEEVTEEISVPPAGAKPIEMEDEDINLLPQIKEEIYD